MSKTDVRIVKTKNAIREALFELMKTKPIGKITIKEISEAAGINRKTFYTHYSTIEDIAIEIEDELLEEMKEYINLCLTQNFPLTPFTFLQFVNNIYTSNPEFCHSFISMRNYNIFVEKIKALMKIYLLSAINSDGDTTTAYKTELMIDFFVSGMAAVYVSWLKKGKPCEFSELAEFLPSI